MLKTIAALAHHTRLLDLLDLPLIALARDTWTTWRRTRLLPDEKRMALYHSLADRHRTPRPIRQCVDDTFQVASDFGRRPDAPQARVLAVWSKALRDKFFADAIRGWVPPSEAMLIAASERVGDLAAGLDEVAEIISLNTYIRDEIRNATREPLIVLGIGAGVFLFTSPYLLAAVDRLFADTDSMAVMVYRLCATAVWDNLAVIATIIAGAPTVYRFLLANWTGRYRKVADGLWPFSSHRLTSGLPLLAALAFLVEHRHTEKQALRLMRPYATPYELERIDAWLARMDNGASLGRAMVDSNFSYPTTALTRQVADLQSATFAQGLKRLVATEQKSARRSAIEQAFWLKLAAYVGLLTIIGLIILIYVAIFRLASTTIDI